MCEMLSKICEVWSELHICQPINITSSDKLSDKDEIYEPNTSRQNKMIGMYVDAVVLKWNCFVS